MLRTTEELEALSKIDPQLEQILKQIGPLPDITQLEPAQIREAAKLRVRQLPGVADPDFTSVVTEDITIPTRDQQTIPARVYKPANGSADGSPLILNFHGGGFVLGGIENDDLVCKNWTKTLGAVVVSVEYRKAPEFKFPYAVHDAYDSLNWVAANASALGGNPSLGFIIAGTSAGAKLANVAAHQARDDKLSPSLTGSLLIIPTAIGDPRQLPDKYRSHHVSHLQNADAPLLNSKTGAYFMNHYAPDTESHLYKPFFWPGGHAEMPPTCFMVCGMDPLRDDGLIYEEALKDAGVQTKSYMYPGMPHGFTSMFPQLPAAEKFVKDGIEGLEWLLKEGKARA